MAMLWRSLDELGMTVLGMLACDSERGGERWLRWKRLRAMASAEARGGYVLSKQKTLLTYETAVLSRRTIKASTARHFEGPISIGLMPTEATSPLFS